MTSDNSFSFACMITFSKPRKMPIDAIATKEENTPHSPKASGVYSRVKIGVTTIGNIYIIMLLRDIFAVFLTSGVLNILFILLFKFKIFRRWNIVHGNAFTAELYHFLQTGCRAENIDKQIGNLCLFMNVFSEITCESVFAGPAV